MPSREKHRIVSQEMGVHVAGQHPQLFAGVLSSMNQTAEMQEPLASGSADIALARVQETVALEKGIAAMTVRAVSLSDTEAMATLPQRVMQTPQRAMQTGANRAAACAIRNMQAALSLYTQAFAIGSRRNIGDPGAARTFVFSSTILNPEGTIQ